ncbi:MAG TPA: TRL domain-containing protein [Myxococcota bacterium]|nr:TRL domain-containing protein [Myxococcota bacterium]
MRQLRVALLCLLSVPLLTGCLYMNVKTVLDTDLDRTELGTKTGKSEAYSVLWAVAWGDAGTQAAAQQGGLTQINHADQELFVILFGVYARTTTILYGN